MVPVGSRVEGVGETLVYRVMAVLAITLNGITFAFHTLIRKWLTIHTGLGAMITLVFEPSVLGLLPQMRVF